MDYKILDAKLEHINDLVLMALALWKDNSYDDLKEDFKNILENENEKMFICKIQNEYVGFIHMSIRYDYVEGSNSSPVGYIEGIYVKPNFRCRKLANSLVKSGEQWAKSNGCSQLGSDIEENNNISYEFHKRIGFKEVNRIICFLKDI